MVYRSHLFILGSAESIRHDFSRQSLGSSGSHPLLHPYPFNKQGNHGDANDNNNNNKLGLSDYIAMVSVLASWDWFMLLPSLYS